MKREAVVAVWVVLVRGLGKISLKFVFFIDQLKEVRSMILFLSDGGSKCNEVWQEWL